MYYSNWFVMSYMLFLACFTKCSVKCTHQIRVTFKRNVSTSSKKLDIVTKSELVIKTCSVNAALMSIMDQIDPPWQTANVFVLFNAFETLCFPHVDMSQVYFSSVNVRKSCKYQYIHFAVGSGQGLREWTSAAACMRTKQTERNRKLPQ